MLTKELTTEGWVQPRFIEPMYAEAVREFPAGAVWTYEAKLDGYRCLAARRGSNVDLWSRRGNSFKFRFPKIAEAFRKLLPDTLIDGEVVALDQAGLISFNALQHSQAAHLQFYAFDILLYRGHYVCRLPIERRRDLLAEALAKVQYPVLRSTPFEAEPADWFVRRRNSASRASSPKRKGSVYEPGRRSGAWLKYRINKGQELVIGGYTRGNPFDALIVGYYDGPKLTFVAKVRNGFVPRVRSQVYAALTPLHTDQCPFINLPEKKRTMYSLTREEMKNCQWLSRGSSPKSSLWNGRRTVICGIRPLPA